MRLLCLGVLSALLAAAGVAGATQTPLASVVRGVAARVDAPARALDTSTFASRASVVRSIGRLRAAALGGQAALAGQAPGTPSERRALALARRGLADVVLGAGQLAALLPASGRPLGDAAKESLNRALLIVDAGRDELSRASRRP